MKDHSQRPPESSAEFPANPPPLPVRAGPTYRARPRRREFLITCGTDEAHRESGFGLTLDAVLADLADIFRTSAARDVGVGAGDDAEMYDDEVIWEGNRVAAVVRVDAEGRLEVIRLDGPDSAPGGTVLAVIE